MGLVLMKQRPALPLLPLYMSLQRIQASRNTRHLSATCFTCSPLAVCGHLECTAASRGMRVFNAVCGMWRRTTPRLDISHLLASGDDENLKLQNWLPVCMKGRITRTWKMLLQSGKKCVCCFFFLLLQKQTRDPELKKGTSEVNSVPRLITSDSTSSLSWAISLSRYQKQSGLQPPSWFIDYLWQPLVSCFSMWFVLQETTTKQSLLQIQKKNNLKS